MKKKLVRKVLAICLISGIFLLWGMSPAWVSAQQDPPRNQQGDGGSTPQAPSPEIKGPAGSEGTDPGDPNQPKPKEEKKEREYETQC